MEVNRNVIDNQPMSSAESGDWFLGRSFKIGSPPQLRYNRIHLQTNRIGDRA